MKTKQQIRDILWNYSKDANFVYQNREYEMKIIDEVFFDEIVDRIYDINDNEIEYNKKTKKFIKFMNKGVV